MTAIVIVGINNWIYINILRILYVILDNYYPISFNLD
jgi:hypothetical protein